jgi:hypothetical protein
MARDERIEHVNKMPTIYLRNEENRRYVTDQVNPDAAWVFAGEGVPSRKYDGTCVYQAGFGEWYARREVKPGKMAPPNFVLISYDEVTGKTMGWEPIEQSAFAQIFIEAVSATLYAPEQTYELLGPKINGNPEKVSAHLLIPHGYMSLFDTEELESLGERTHPRIGAWLNAHPDWEGIVFRHADGRMAKIKARDFRGTVR